MDNSFKPQGEFQPDGEFNAPEPPREFVDIVPAVAIKLPYEQRSKLALFSTIKAVVLFIIGLILLIPSIIASAQATIGSVPMVFLTLIFFALSAIASVYSIIFSIKGVKAKFTMAVWSMAISSIILVPALILAIICAQSASLMF